MEVIIIDYKMYLLSCIASLGTAWFVQYLKDKQQNRISKKQERSLAALFIALTISYELHIQANNELPWKNKIWDINQAKMALAFPDETAIFSFVLLEVESDLTFLEDSSHVRSVSAALQRIRESLKQRYKLTNLQLYLETMI